ncbi:MAG: S8 family serine peptidase [Candidatus Heimdallarchaeota archaeon]|nr:S8 family serine peptidase [Candidatus Heimdallarchaeota archaeon]MCK4955835.1 S8 family serine peptidase [Candidatus Heimdallarchaeota archaeon]
MKIENKILVFVLISSLFIPTLNTMSMNYSDQKLSSTNYIAYTDIGWHLDQINITGAWDITVGSKDIVIAVIDSGIDFSHPELNNSWINVNELPADGIDDDANGYIDDTHGWDFVTNDSEPGPQAVDPIHWHATFISGIIMGQLNNIGIAGAAPNVSVMDLRVLDVNNFQGTTDAGLGDAIKYAVDNGADVINLSLQYYANSTDYYDDILYAILNNVPIVSVTGNTWAPTGGLEIPSYPGALVEVIAVGATDFYYNKADYSNYGLPWTEIMAPVGDEEYDVPEHVINSTFPGNLYGIAYGTSFAAPQVAAVIALMRTINSTMPVSEIRSILQTTAYDLGSPGIDIFFGHGLVNATAAVLEVWNRTYPAIPELNNLQISLLLIIIVSSIAIVPIIMKKQKAREI